MNHSFQIIQIMKPYLAILVFISLLSCKDTHKTALTHPLHKDHNIINFEKSDYGLLFTTISVNGTKVKAMIDFGDPNVLQHSSSFVASEKILVSKTEAVAKDLFENTFEIHEGNAKKVIIGNWEHKNIEFSSSPNEMESVSKQINTKFDAVIGWGYFSKTYSQIDYKANRFILTDKKAFEDNILFTTSFNKNSNYLNVPVGINNAEANFIIDTGSPISMIDSGYYHQRQFKDIAIKLGDKEVLLHLEIQNLEILNQLNAKGIIGGDFLEQYKINIDPFKNELSFKKQNYCQKGNPLQKILNNTYKLSKVPFTGTFVL